MRHLGIRRFSKNVLSNYAVYKTTLNAHSVPEQTPDL